MAVLQLYEWCLYPRKGVCGNVAIREAVAQRSATMAFGTHLFAYRDQELPEGGHLLTLTPLPGDGEEEVLDGYTVEQRVPPGLPHWDEESRSRLVLVMGHVLFEDTARLLTVDARFR